MNLAPASDLPPGVSREFLAVFRARADPSGTMTFARFMELALYDPAVGYYRHHQRRAGYGPETDFFTATTSGAIFGELVAAACVSLLAPDDPHDFMFVEIGVESAGAAPPRVEHGVLTGVDHPFGAVRAIPLSEPVILTGKCIVFSNELFDAQPFHRFIFRRGAWRELGVALREGLLGLVELATLTPVALPPTAPEGYVVDAPLAARALAGQIAGQPWSGLFVAADYGKSWRELAEETPAGTARSYYRHRQSNDLLARPGEQDITCHICWDWLVAALEGHGFAAPQIETQESFFVHHAGEVIAATSAAEAARFSRRKLALAQLLHPSHLGQKFQVLHARR